jgi:choline dehydrogenase-like flavoprotein
MELDGEVLKEGERLAADLCIIGAGPAGITIAREAIARDMSVLLLESGGPVSEMWPQTLNEGSVTAEGYAGLRITRHRQAGGTSRIWNTPTAGATGAKFVPLDPWDLGRWPIPAPELLPFYQRAQEILGLGPFSYEGADWATPTRPLAPLEGGPLTSRIYQFGPAAIFVRHLAAIAAAPNVRLCHHATVCELVASADRSRVIEARIRCPSGRQIGVHAERFVVAAGAIENARLLLASGLGGDQVGRCFMEHPRDQSLTLVPAPGAFERLRFYDTHSAAGGVYIGGRLAPAVLDPEGSGLPNFSVTLLPRFPPRKRPSGLAARIFYRIRRRLSPPLSQGYGWSGWKAPPREFLGFRLLLNLEQRPDPENRLELATDTDALGMRRVHLHWRWTGAEQEGLRRVRALVAGSLESAGLGRVRLEQDGVPDPNAHHHAGTTRMSRDPRDGVVDPGGQVHGMENLFLAGGSVFPVSGYANPTLTIVALALRLADRLAG